MIPRMSTTQENSVDGPDLRHLNDELAIRNLLCRLARVVDVGTVEEYLAHFTEDAEWSMSAAPNIGMEAQRTQGHAALAAGFTDRINRGVQGPGSNTRHVLTTIDVHITGDDTAEADAYWLYLTTTTTTPVIAATGAYRHHLTRCEDGAWRIARRHIVQG